MSEAADEIERLRALSQPEGKAEAVAEYTADINNVGERWVQVTISGAGADKLTEDQIEAALQPSGQTRAEIIEECAKVAEAWDGKPCGHAFGWTDDQRDYYDAGQLDASSSIVRAIRALAAQEKEKTQT